MDYKDDFKRRNAELGLNYSSFDENYKTVSKVMNGKGG